jgi:rRNA processing protein Gar1
MFKMLQVVGNVAGSYVLIRNGHKLNIPQKQLATIYNQIQQKIKP